MKQRRQRELGFGHIGLLLGISLACIVFVGVITWQRRNRPEVSEALKTALANAQCGDATDADLCKFYAASRAQPYTSVQFTMSGASGNNTGSYQTDNNGDYHLTVARPASHYEIIGLDTALYSKNADNSWWKVQVPRSELDKYNSGPGVGLTFADAQPGITYKKQDSSACQNHAALTCLQYQLSDAAAAGTARFIWFDTANYQLQRQKTIDTSGTTDATFAYTKVKIKKPPHAKDLPHNKYLVPGQVDPVILPAGASWDSSAGGLIDQYQQAR